MEYRTEHDFLGAKAIPATALWGIHTQRALENFGSAVRPVHSELIRAFGYVKLACLKANVKLKYLSSDKGAAIEQACEEMIEGKLNQWILVDSIQGGAGTSLNMNINEVLCNRALEILGREKGNYEVCHPNDTINLHQSTNDTFPTALRVAILLRLKDLELSLTTLLEAFQDAEKRFATVVKVGRTQLQDGVPITLGREMGAYAEAVSRDRWRVFKCAERLKTINLGGTAIGTGITAPRRFIFMASENLRELTSLPLARAENLIEATQNLDAFVETAGILKTVASNLIKIGNDLRLLSSGPDSGLNEIVLPSVQEGSSIMPGKVNPVIPEYAVQVGLLVYGYEGMISQAVAMGNLELNAFLPTISWAYLSMLEILERATTRLASGCISGVIANAEYLRKKLSESGAAAVVLVPILGHEKASEIALAARKRGISIGAIVKELGLLSEEEWEKLISPQKLNSLGDAKSRAAMK